MNFAKRLCLVFASSLLLPVAVAQGSGTISFKVPYKYTNISTEYVSVQIICSVNKPGGAVGLAASSKIPLDANGSASGTVDLVTKVNPGQSLADATNWICVTGFTSKSGAHASAKEVAKAGTNPVGEAKGTF